MRNSIAALSSSKPMNDWSFDAVMKRLIVL
jgi:hypothetical protein